MRTLGAAHINAKNTEANCPIWLYRVQVDDPKTRIPSDATRLKSVNWETGDDSQFDSTSVTFEDFPITSDAAMALTRFGKEITGGSPPTGQGRIEVIHSERYQWISFWIDPSNVATVSGNTGLRLLRIRITGQNRFLRATFSTGGIVADSLLFSQAGIFSLTTDLPNRRSFVRLEIIDSTTSSSGDGEAAIYIDNVCQGRVTGLSFADAWDSYSIDVGHMESWSNITGSLYLDEITVDEADSAVTEGTIDPIPSDATTLHTVTWEDQTDDEFSETDGNFTSLAISTGAAMNGTSYGKELPGGNGSPADGDVGRFNISNAKRYRWVSFWINLNTVENNQSAVNASIMEMNNGSQVATLSINMPNPVSSPRTVFFTRTDAPTVVGSIPDTGNVHIRLELIDSTTSSSNDGEMAIYVDGGEQDRNTGLNFQDAWDDYSIEFGRATNWGNLDGTVYLDEIIIQEADSVNLKPPPFLTDLYFTEREADTDYFRTDSGADIPQTYRTFPIRHHGIEETTDGRIGRMKITLSSVSLEIPTFLENASGLRGRKVTIRHVFEETLDNASAYLQEELFIDSVVVGDLEAEFTLVTRLDLLRVQLPNRLYSRKHCFWEYKGPCCWLDNGDGTFSAPSGFHVDETLIFTKDGWKEGDSSTIVENEKFDDFNLTGILKTTDSLVIDLKIDDPNLMDPSGGFIAIGNGPDKDTLDQGWSRPNPGALAITADWQTFELPLTDFSDVNGGPDESAINVFQVELPVTGNTTLYLRNLRVILRSPWQFATGDPDSCNHTEPDCKRHNNFSRFGAQPAIPSFRTRR